MVRFCSVGLTHFIPMGISTVATRVELSVARMIRHGHPHGYPYGYPSKLFKGTDIRTNVHTLWTVTWISLRISVWMSMSNYPCYRQWKDLQNVGNPFVFSLFWVLVVKIRPKLSTIQKHQHPVSLNKKNIKNTKILLFNVRSGSSLGLKSIKDF